MPEEQSLHVEVVTASTSPFGCQAAPVVCNISRSSPSFTGIVTITSYDNGIASGTPSSPASPMAPGSEPPLDDLALRVTDVFRAVRWPIVLAALIARAMMLALMIGVSAVLVGKEGGAAATSTVSVITVGPAVYSADCCACGVVSPCTAVPDDDEDDDTCFTPTSGRWTELSLVGSGGGNETSSLEPTLS